MTSFGWKKKAGENVSKRAASSFTKDVKEDNDDEEHVDWLNLIPKNKSLRLEDNIGKSERLKKEGVILAESERFWEAIRKWDEAIVFNPTNASLYEMKAQALMNLNELFPALTAATKVIEIDPLWWVGYQTLGRAHLNMGEVKLAIKDFSRAIHLNPSEEELWKDDLMWAYKLVNKQQTSTAELHSENATLTIREIEESNDYFNSENNPPNSENDTPNSENNPPNSENNPPTTIESNTTSIKLVSGRFKEQRTDSTNINSTTTSVKTIPKNYVQMRDG